jgi:uncharacterized protein (TIGR03437 family)
VVNAASFTPEVALGSVASIFGAGLAESKVRVNGTEAAVLASFPFQVNAQIPLTVSPGEAEIAVTSAYGAARQTIALREVAPAIFSIGPEQAAITNQDNRLNTPSNPAIRGGFLVIYGTGFGTVSRAGGLDRTATPVSVVIGSTEIPAAFAGLTPGAIGLYQANVQTPPNMPPGLSLPLYLKQGTAVSNTVRVAVQ